MNKSELISDIAEDINLPKRAVESVLNQLGAAAAAALYLGEEVTLPGIGKLHVKMRRGRTGRNPRTGEAIEIPARMVISFRTAKALKDYVCLALG